MAGFKGKNLSVFSNQSRTYVNIHLCKVLLQSKNQACARLYMVEGRESSLTNTICMICPQK